MCGSHAPGRAGGVFAAGPPCGTSRTSESPPTACIHAPSAVWVCTPRGRPPACCALRALLSPSPALSAAGCQHAHTHTEGGCMAGRPAGRQAGRLPVAHAALKGLLGSFAPLCSIRTAWDGRAAASACCLRRVGDGPVMNTDVDSRRAVQSICMLVAVWIFSSDPPQRALPCKGFPVPCTGTHLRQHLLP